MFRNGTNVPRGATFIWVCVCRATDWRDIVSGYKRRKTVRSAMAGRTVTVSVLDTVSWGVCGLEIPVYIDQYDISVQRRTTTMSSTNIEISIEKMSSHGGNMVIEDR